MACWAGFALNCKEVHLLSSLRPLCYGKMAFGDKDMGTPLPMSRPVCGGRDLDGAPETGVLGGASGRQSLSPPNLGLSPSAHKPVSAKVGGPRVAPWGTATAPLRPGAPDCGLHPGGADETAGGGCTWGGGGILTSLK